MLWNDYDINEYDNWYHINGYDGCGYDINRYDSGDSYDEDNRYKMNGYNYNGFDDGRFLKWWINDKGLWWNDESVVIQSKKRCKINMTSHTVRSFVNTTL